MNTVCENGRESLFGSAASKPRAETRLQRDIDATDLQIDQLAYELYGLTEEEIKIVEDETTKRSLDKRGWICRKGGRLD